MEEHGPEAWTGGARNDTLARAVTVEDGNASVLVNTGSLLKKADLGDEQGSTCAGVTSSSWRAQEAVAPVPCQQKDGLADSSTHDFPLEEGLQMGKEDGSRPGARRGRRVEKLASGVERSLYWMQGFRH